LFSGYFERKGTVLTKVCDDGDAASNRVNTSRIGCTPTVYDGGVDAEEEEHDETPLEHASVALVPRRGRRHKNSSGNTDDRELGI
jgi:hypothetical protein